MDVYAQDEVVAMPSAVVVIYHRFGEDTLPSTNISLDQFEAHLRLLQDGNYNVVPLEEVVIALRDGTALPDRTIAITIDDTFRSIYTEAFPRFQVAGFPFTVFVNTDSVDSGQWTVDGGPWTVDGGRCMASRRLFSGSPQICVQAIFSCLYSLIQHRPRSRLVSDRHLCHFPDLYCSEYPRRGFYYFFTDLLNSNLRAPTRHIRHNLVVVL